MKSENRKLKSEAGEPPASGIGNPASGIRLRESGFASLAIIALGSNLGDAPALVLDAMDRLKALSTTPLLRSSLWQSSPVDCPPGSPMFVNAVVALTPLPGETPESFLGKLQALERAFGRRPKLVLNEPRPLDLDLIAFGLEQRASPTLRLPHPRAHERRFVLTPLAEICPALVLPGWSQPAAALLKALVSDELVVKLATAS